jgi:hypothetical protein
MSQPVALIAKISLDAANFRKFLRTPAAELLASCLAAELVNPSGRYIVFRYLKPEKSLFAFCYFNHGNAASLCAADEWQVLRELARYADTGRSGFVLHSLDALNLPDDIVAAYEIVNGACIERPLTDLALEFRQLGKDCDKYFFRATQTDFALQLHRGRIVDKAVVKRCMAMLEARRIEQLSECFDQASYASPMHLFGDYYFNGQHVYHVGSELTILPEIDAASFRPASWGGCDARYAALGHELLPVDVPSFKMLQKGELVFYKDKSQVFSSAYNRSPSRTTVLLPQADAASFRLRSDCHADDATHVYFCGLVIPRSALGNYRVESAGYFHALKLLVGEHAVYLGDSRLPLDAPSFQLEQELAGVSSRSAYLVSDSQGCYLLRRTSLPRGNLGDVVLTRVPTRGAAEALWAQEIQQKENASSSMRDEDKLDRLLTQDGEKSWQQYVEGFERWANEHFDLEYAARRFHPRAWLYRGVNNYFHALFRLGRPQDVLAFYPRIAATAWLNPFIFHHTACSYAALGEMDAALQEVHRAVAFGYEHLDRLWDDPDLVSLRQTELFQTLGQAQTKMPRQAVPEILEAILALPPLDGGPLSRSLASFLRTLAVRVSFAPPPPDEQDTPQALALRRVFRHYLNHHVVDPTPPSAYCRTRGLVDFYAMYREHPYLHPLAHWVRIAGMYRHAHGWNKSIDREEIATALSLLPSLCAAVAAARSGGDASLVADIDCELQRSGLFGWALTQGLDRL